MRGSVWAVFDVDGTLLPGTSMERLLMHALVTEGWISGCTFIRFLVSVFADAMRGGIPALMGNKGYFQNLRADAVRERSERLVRETVSPRIPTEAAAEIRRMRRNGHRILLLSGAPDFLLDPLAMRLGADAALGTVLETKNGRLTGRVRGDHLYGPVKTSELKKAAASLGMDFKRSVVYANDSSDEAHMRLFGTAVAVNPRPKLRLLAERHRWRIVHW